MHSLRELEEQRRFACRLSPDRALQSLDDAHAFLRERGMLTRTEDSALPSLYAACHEPAFKPGSRGFGSWPATKWPWFDELAARPGVYAVKLHRGKHVLLSADTAALADPVLRSETKLLQAESPDAARVLAHLAEAGASTPEEIRAELGYDGNELKRIRTELERRGAVVSRVVRVQLPGGKHEHVSELTRWDQAFPEPSRHGGVEELVVACVRAAVVAPEREVPRWLGRSGLVPKDIVARLVAGGRLVRPEPGWVASR